MWGEAPGSAGTHPDDGKRLQACLKRLELQSKTKSKTITMLRGLDFSVFRVPFTCGNARVYMGRVKRDGVYMATGAGLRGLTCCVSRGPGSHGGSTDEPCGPIKLLVDRLYKLPSVVCTCMFAVV